MIRDALMKTDRQSSANVVVGRWETEASRLSQILARLKASKSASASRPKMLSMASQQAPVEHPHLPQAKFLYRAVKRRSGIFPKRTFGECGWEILLALFIRDGVTRLCIRELSQLTDTPTTTVLRWLKVLQDQSLITIHKHQLDRRVSLVELTQLGRENFADYLREVVR